MVVRPPNKQEEKRKAQALEQLEADRVKLLLDSPFTGSILIRQNLIPVVDSRCETACTDGQNIFVNPDFYLAMTPGERRFLLAHEVWHTVFLHFQRRGKRDRDLFNIAADMEVNALLRSEKFKIPADALLPKPSWKGFNAEEIYEKLLPQDAVELQIMDIHPEPGDDRQPSSDGTSPDIIEDPDFQIDFGNHPGELAKEKVIEAAIQCEKKRGELPGNIAQIVKSFRNGTLHWKELLAQFVTSCFGGSRIWLPPNRRYISSGLYLQSRRDRQLNAVLAFDTSGSTRSDLPRFAGELANLLNSFGHYELKVICCDTKIQSVETFSDNTPFDAKKFTFKGGGGTSFTPVFEYLKKEDSAPELLIYLTDGYGDIPEKPDFPVLWVITERGKNGVPWGSEAHMD